MESVTSMCQHEGAQLENAGMFQESSFCANQKKAGHTKTKNVYLFPKSQSVRQLSHKRYKSQTSDVKHTTHNQRSAEKERWELDLSENTPVMNIINSGSHNSKSEMHTSQIKMFPCQLEPSGDPGNNNQRGVGVCVRVMRWGRVFYY